MKDEQYFRTAAYGASTRDLALTAFGVYAGMKMARESHDALYEAAAAVQDEVCSMLCPSVWRTAEGRPPHHPKCQALRDALASLTAGNRQNESGG